jgi:MFS family permease
MDTSGGSSLRLSPEQARANYRRLVLDIAWFGLAFPAVAQYLSLYAIRLNASAALLGWLAALPSVVALMTSALAGWWGRKFSNIVVAQFWPGVAYRLVFLLPALTPIFPSKWQTIWLLLAATLPAIPQGVSSVLFLVLMRRGIEDHQITALISRRSLAVNVTVGISTLIFGFWLTEGPFPFNYQAMFVVAFVLAMMSLFNVRRVRLPTPEPQPSPERPPIQPWKSMAFRKVALVTIMAHIALFSIAPIISLRLVDDLGANEGFISIFALAGQITAAMTAAFATRIIQRMGTLNTIAIGLVGTGLSAVVFALSPYLALTIPASALGGAAWTAAAIALFGYFSENTPAESLTSFTTVYNQLIMLAVFIGPMIGSQLASNTSLGLGAVLMIGAVLRVLVGGLISGVDVDWRGRFRRRLVPVTATANPSDDSL